MNIASIIERNAQRYSGQTALHDAGQDISYAELNARANRAANGLRALGVKPGERVALFLPNGLPFVVAYFGALKVGAMAVSLNPMLKTGEVEFILNDCGATVVVTNAPMCDHVLAARLHSVRHIIVAGEPVPGTLAFDQWLQHAAPHAHALEVAPQHPAAIVYTSGTTGQPKGATLSHANVFSTMAAKVRYCGTQPTDRLLLFLPIAHCFGQNAILNHGLSAGATVVLQPRFELEQTLEVIRRERITMFFGVPTVYARMLDLDIPPAALHTIRYFFTAGAPMPIEIARRWRERYQQIIYEGYGLTETSPFAAYNHREAYRVGSVGAPIDGVAMDIVAPDGQPLRPGERGEIVIRGPNVMLGYWNQPQATRAAIRDGWFHTGDIGTVDEHGYFFVVDRLKDMINVAGFKVYPAEVEQMLYQHPAVAEAAVYGVPDQLQGEIVKASVRLRDGHVSQTIDLATFCRARMANYKVPRVVEFVETLPKNATGKIMRRTLREQTVGVLEPV